MTVDDRLGCYRPAARWYCHRAADLRARLRLEPDGVPVDVVLDVPVELLALARLKGRAEGGTGDA